RTDNNKADDVVDGPASNGIGIVRIKIGHEGGDGANTRIPRRAVELVGGRNLRQRQGEGVFAAPATEDEGLHVSTLTKRALLPGSMGPASPTRPPPNPAGRINCLDCSHRRSEMRRNP